MLMPNPRQQAHTEHEPEQLRSEHPARPRLLSPLVLMLVFAIAILLRSLSF